MPLTTKEQEQLDTIFKDPVVVKIIFCTQLYLLIQNPDLDYAIKNAKSKIFSQTKQLNILPSIEKQLPIVIEQIVTCLGSQQELFLNQLIIDSLKKYYASVKTKKPKSAREILEDFINDIKGEYKKHHNHHHRRENIQNEIFDIKLSFVAAKYSALSFNSEAIYLAIQKSVSHVIIILAVMSLYSLLFFEGSYGREFQFGILCSVLSTLLLYFYLGKKALEASLSSGINRMLKVGTSNFRLHRIEYIDTHNETKTIFLPTNPEESITHFEQQTEVEKIKSKIKSPKKNLPAKSKIPRFLGFGPKLVIWPNKTLLKNPNEEWISSDSEYVVNIQGGHYPNNRFYAFFNLNALEKQLDTKPESIPFKNYYTRWEESKIVSETGHNGNKKLTPPYGENIGEPILNKDAPKQWLLFQWELKTKGEDNLDRCLGSECSTVMSANGEQHILIDYCFHKPGGLH